MTDERTRGDGVETGRRMLAVLEALDAANGAGVTDVARELGVAKSTAHAHLQTLHSEEYVVRRNGEYFLGLQFLGLGQGAKRRFDDHEAIEQKVEDLAEETQLRAQFLVAEHGEAVYVYRSTGRHSVPTDSRVGVRIPLHSVAAGKAILASMAEETVEAVLDRHGLEASTDNTIDTVDELRAELDRIRERGYAVNDEESWEGVQAVGAPITTPDGDVLGGLSVSGSAHRFQPEEFADLVMGAANEIELTLRYD